MKKFKTVYCHVTVLTLDENTYKMFLEEHIKQHEQLLGRCISMKQTFSSKTNFYAESRLVNCNTTIIHVAFIYIKK